MRKGFALFGVIAALLVSFPTGRFAQSATGTLGGTVRSSTDGNPLGGVRVFAMVVPDSQKTGATNLFPSIVKNVDTDAQGRYRIEGLPPGRYHVVAGSLVDPVYYPGVVEEARATAVSVTAGSVRDGLDLARKPLTMGEEMRQNSTQGAYELWKLRDGYKAAEASSFESIDDMHRYFVARFIATPGLGSGRMAAQSMQLDPSRRLRITQNSGGAAAKAGPLEVAKLELIGIARHAQPVAFERIAHGGDRWATRTLSAFESRALPELQSGRDTVSQEISGGRLVVGAIRAEASCLGCHSTQKEGDVLGAFSYTLGPPSVSSKFLRN